MILYNLDVVSDRHISGWAFSESSDVPIKVKVVSGDDLLVEGRTTTTRPDVNAAFSKAPAEVGFTIPLPAIPKGPKLSRPLQIYLTDANGDVVRITSDTFPTIFEATLFQLSDEAVTVSADQIAVASPFPKEIAQTIQLIYGSPTDSNTATDMLLAMLRSDRRGNSPALMKYVRYIRSIWSHFNFVERNFQETNSGSSSEAKDWLCKANTPSEMISIAHQLYVLQSYGIDGILAEFGCFKGYSTSMLSYACSLLNKRMHVFDSFEGLPESSSVYYKSGEFKGDLDEVRRNVSIFGAIDSVTLHKGFFSDSLKTWKRAPIACLWMDVDLESSARDVMQVADSLVPDGAVFSHECSQENFANGSIMSPQGADYVIPAIVDRLGRDGLLGQYVAGHTGVFWRGNIPVLPHDLLLKIVRAA